MKIILLLYILSVFDIFPKYLAQKAFLMSSSIGFYNYRQNANTLKIYQTLKSNGFQDTDIVLSFPENVGCCEKNNIPGTVSFYDNDYANLNKNVEVDLKYYSHSLKQIANSLMIKRNPSLPGLNDFKIGQQPYFVYFTGHGGDQYFKIRQRKAFVRQNFEQFFKDIIVRFPHNLLLVLIDSCSAITPYQYIKGDNFIALGSSSYGEKSLSKGFDATLNMPKSDQFTFYLDEFLMKSTNQGSIKDLLSYMDYGKLKVHSKLISPNRRNTKRKLNEFVIKKKSINHKKNRLSIPTIIEQHH